MKTLKLTLNDNKRFEEAAALHEQIVNQIKQVIVGQDGLIERIMLSIIIGGHCLLEGAPGLAKTLLMKTICACVDGSFKRIQFTPDLLPADLLGIQVYNPANQSFSFSPGPIFSNLVLVDEINRAPAKVQSALLEAMQEKQVTTAGLTYKLDELFTVLATQNPLEHEGTYPLPEAQIDRFTFKLLMQHPSQHEEEAIVQRFCVFPYQPTAERVCTPNELIRLRRLAEQVFVEPEIIHQIVKLVQATRHPERYRLDELKDKIEHGASPRASIILTQASKGLALLRGRSYVLMKDLQDIACDVLRHRIKPSYRALMEGVDADSILNILLNRLIASGSSPIGG